MEGGGQIGLEVVPSQTKLVRRAHFRRRRQQVLSEVSQFVIEAEGGGRRRRKAETESKTQENAHKKPTHTYKLIVQRRKTEFEIWNAIAFMTIIYLGLKVY